MNRDKSGKGKLKKRSRWKKMRKERRTVKGEK